MIITRGFEAENPEDLKIQLAEFYSDSLFASSDIEKQGRFVHIHENGNEYEIPRCFVNQFQVEVNALIEYNNYVARECEDYARQCRG